MLCRKFELIPTNNLRVMAIGIVPLLILVHVHVLYLNYYRHGVRAPIPQTQGVLIEQEAVPSKKVYYKIIIIMLCVILGRTFHRRKLPTSVFDPFQDFSGKRSQCTTASGFCSVIQTISSLIYLITL